MMFHTYLSCKCIPTLLCMLTPFKPMSCTHMQHTHIMNSRCDVYIYSNKATVLCRTITGYLENFGGISIELLKSPYRLKSDRTRCYQYNNNTPTAATCNPKKSNFKYFFLNAYGHLWKKCALDVAV
jgi:hypothetical protein